MEISAPEILQAVLTGQTNVEVKKKKKSTISVCSAKTDTLNGIRFDKSHRATARR